MNDVTVEYIYIKINRNERQQQQQQNSKMRTKQKTCGRNRTGKSGIITKERHKQKICSVLCKLLLFSVWRSGWEWKKKKTHKKRQKTNKNNRMKKKNLKIKVWDLAHSQPYTKMTWIQCTYTPIVSCYVYECSFSHQTPWPTWERIFSLPVFLIIVLFSILPEKTTKQKCYRQIV